VQITIYKTPDCPRCRELAAYLRGLGIDFEEQDMSHPAVITDLRCDNVFALAAPVLRVGDDYYDPDVLLDGDRLAIGRLDELFGRERRRRAEERSTESIKRPTKAACYLAKARRLLRGEVVDPHCEVEE